MTSDVCGDAGTPEAAKVTPLPPMQVSGRLEAMNLIAAPDATAAVPAVVRPVTSTRRPS